MGKVIFQGADAAGEAQRGQGRHTAQNINNDQTVTTMLITQTTCSGSGTVLFDY